MCKAAGYCRVSTEDQAREGTSLEAQATKIRSYCSAKDLELVELISDEGLSAKSLVRPGIQKVLSMAMKKEVDSIIIWKLDRMFRCTIDALQTTKLFEQWGISFHSISEDINTQSATGKFFFTLLAALAEMERQIISERTIAALNYKRAQGKRISGKAPFGFRFDDHGNIVINPEEHATLDLMKDLRKKNLSYKKIADALNQLGHRTRSGTFFRREGVFKTLKRNKSNCKT